MSNNIQRTIRYNWFDEHDNFDNITNVHIEVANYSGKPNPNAFLDWLTTMQDYFEWYDMTSDWFVLPRWCSHDIAYSEGFKIAWLVKFNVLSSNGTRLRCAWRKISSVGWLGSFLSIGDSLARWRSKNTWRNSTSSIICGIVENEKNVLFWFKTSPRSEI